MTEPWRLHPSMRGRRKPLESPRYACDFELDEDADTPPGVRRFRCAGCRRPWTVHGPGEPPGDLPCNRLKQSRLASVSERREERLDRIGARGPLCDHVGGLTCLVPGCSEGSDPAHVRAVGKGYGDFVWDEDEGSWVGNVADLCRFHHDYYDGRLVGRAGGRNFEMRFRVDVAAWAREIGNRWMEFHGVDPTSRVPPYEQEEANA